MGVSLPSDSPAGTGGYERGGMGPILVWPGSLASV
jgi:hypothetical protein